MVWVVNRAGAETWGQIVLVMAWMGYILAGVDFGASSLAAVQNLNNDAEESNFRLITLWKHMVVGLLSCVAFTVIYLNTGTRIWLYLAIYGFVLFCKAFAPEWIFYRRECSGLLGKLLAVRNVFQIALLLVLQSEMSVAVFFVTEVAAEILMTGLVIWKWPGVRSFQVNMPTREIMLRYAKPGAVVFAMNLAVLVHTNADIFILDWFTNKAEVGLYSSAYRVVVFYFMIGGALSLVFRTRAAMLIQKGELRSISILMRVCLKTLFGLSLLYVILSNTFLKPLLAKIFNLPNLLDTQILEILGGYIVIAFVSIIFSEYYMAIGRRRELLFVTVSASIVNVISNLYFVPQWSVNGAATATVCAEMLIMIWLVSRANVKGIFQTSLKAITPPLLVILWVGGVLYYVENPWLELSLTLLAFPALALSGWYSRMDIRTLANP